MDIAKIETLDSGIFQAAKNFHILKHLAWPIEEEEKFLSSWRKGNPKLPKFTPEIPDFKNQISELENLMHQCDQSDPIEKFLFETAQSYVFGGKMLEAVGTKDFTLYSTKIYGRPDDTYKNQNVTAIDSAKFLLEVTDNLLGAALIPSTSYDISSADFADWMKSNIDDFFNEDPVKVVIDDSISAKALAGSKSIKICESAHFSELDKKQLLNHEAFIHSATMLNGKKQENLKCLALGSPRTTRTQEGLAVLSELATLSMDITRLRRVALRVLAIDMALGGADFIDLFKYFLKEGQTEEDSVRSAQRIFRGGDVKDGVVFTKDGVYLQGLFEIHTFMRVAIWHNRPELIQNLFAGRMTVGDSIRLSPFFQDGWLRPPQYIPEWASDFRRLAAQLAYSAFVANIRLEKITFERILEFEENLKLRA